MDNKSKPSQTEPHSLPDNGFETAQKAPPSYTPTSRTAVDSHMSATQGYEMNGQPAQPNARGPTMEYAPHYPLRSQQEIAYRVPFGDAPVQAQCPVCQQRAMSKIQHVSGGYTFVWALGLCAVTGLGCIPFCVSRLKNVEHRCGNCNEKLATWHRYDGRVDVRA